MEVGIPIEKGAIFEVVCPIKTHWELHCGVRKNVESMEMSIGRLIRVGGPKEARIR